MDDSTLARFLGKPGDAVPPVDPADLKAVWKVYEDCKEHDPATRAGGAFVDLGILQRVCNSQADTPAVIYRSWMLGILERYFDLDLALGDWRSQLKDNGQFREPVFKAAARMPLTWMAVGVPANGFPFDVSAFIEEVRKESEGV